MNIGLILQIISSALQLAPIGVEAISRIKGILAADPTIAEGMQAILDGTIATDDATVAMVQEFRALAGQ
jgi:hypothetical protein